MKKIIGLIPLYDDEKESYWMLPGYMKAVEAGGGLPLMLPLTGDQEELEQCLDLCGGLLLTGGHDVNPALYEEEPIPACGSICRERDEMEAFLLKQALARDLPMLGICRGIQFMNAVLGGTLYQDLESQHPSAVRHHMTPPYDRPVHSIRVMEGTLLAEVIGEGSHKVNSYHHQAVRTLAPGLEAMAVSEDGLIEALCIPDQKFAVGVQWHPEFSYKTDPGSMRLVQAFIDACLSRKL